MAFSPNRTESRVRVFVSYALEDENYFTSFAKHLRAIERQGIIDSWSSKLDAGADVEEATRRRIQAANIIIILLSPNYLASDHCWDFEFREAMARRAAEQATVVPVVLCPCAWRHTPIRGLKILPSDEQAVVDWPSLDHGFNHVIEQLIPIVADISTRNAETVSTPDRLFGLRCWKNSNFTGRQDTLDQIRSNFASTSPEVRTQILTGLGGVGKTQLAVQYAERHRHNYAVVWWIEGADRATLQRDYTELARQLQLVRADEYDAKVKESAVRNWLERHDSWLLIFDDVPDPDWLLPSLPRSCRGNIIITSREAAWHRLGLVIVVGGLDRASSVEYLMRATGQSDEHGANAVAEILGDLPLAMEQASAFMDAEAIPFHRYVELFSERYKEIWSREELYTPTDHRETVATTFSFCVERVEAASKDAAALLRLCAFFAPDHIPYFIFEGSGGMLDGPRLESLLGTLRLGAALREVRRYSLIHSNESLMYVHRLVQTVVVDRMSSGERARWLRSAADALADWLPPEQADPQYWPIYLFLIPHLQSIAEQALRYSCYDSAIIGILNWTGLFLRQIGSYHLAEANYRMATNLCESSPAANPIDVSCSLGNLSGILLDMKRPEESMQYIERALANSERFGASTEPDPHMAQHLTHRGTALGQLGRVEEGLRDVLRGLQIAEEMRGPDAPQLMYVLNSVGCLYEMNRDYGSAIRQHERAIEILKKNAVNGEPWPIIVTPMVNLARVLHQSGRRKKKCNAYDRGGDPYRKKVLSAESPADVYVLQGARQLHSEEEAPFMRPNRWPLPSSRIVGVIRPIGASRYASAPSSCRAFRESGVRFMRVGAAHPAR